MFTFLLVLHALVAASLVAVILMQRSEGGGLGMGGSPSGLMSARGAADFLTRATTILATIFVVMSIGLAAYAGVQRAQRPIDTSLARPAGAPAGGGAGSAGGVPLADPLAGAASAFGNASALLIPQAAPAPAAAVPVARVPAASVPAPRSATTKPRGSTGTSTGTATGALTGSGPASRTTDPKAPATGAGAGTPPAIAPASATPTPKADSTPATTPAPAATGGGSVPLQH